MDVPLGCPLPAVLPAVSRSVRRFLTRSDPQSPSVFPTNAGFLGDFAESGTGSKLGRPKGSLGVSRLDGKEDEIRRFIELGVSKTAIAKITGVSRTALYSFMTTRGLRPSR